MKVFQKPYRCALARLQPSQHPDIETIKHDGWHKQHLLVISPDDKRLDSFERMFLQGIGNRLYGKRSANDDV